MRFKLALLLSLFISISSAFAETNRFWVWDLTKMPPGFLKPEFELFSSDALSKDKVHLWIERDLGVHQPTPATLSELRTLLGGLIESERHIFGEQPTPPNENRDINVLIAAMPPFEKNGKKYGFDGFFNVFDQLTQTEADEYGQRSNEMNIIYVNALNDLNTPYMHGVIAHELNHLLTYAQYDHKTNDLDPWINEMLGEAAMQLAGYFTDTKHVETYRAHPEWPLAVNGYGLSYGGVSLLAEYLMAHFNPTIIGKIAPAMGNAFERIEHVYKKSWAEIFEGYIHWMFEQSSKSQFGPTHPAIREANKELFIGTTGVSFISDLSIRAEDFRITAVPPACTASQNVVRDSVLTHNGENGESDLSAKAIWIESTPPCVAERGGQGYQAAAFKLERN